MSIKLMNKYREMARFIALVVLILFLFSTISFNVHASEECDYWRNQYNLAIEQAVLALVDNAAKYGPPGGEVRLASSNEPGDRAGRLRVEVSDDGPGIPEEDLERVFERFYRPDKARSRALGGSGLGLSIAKTIVEAHGGSVRADRRPDGGASVSILLPLTVETSRARPRSPGLPRPGS